MYFNLEITMDTFKKQVDLTDSEINDTIIDKMSIREFSKFLLLTKYRRLTLGFNHVIMLIFTSLISAGVMFLIALLCSGLGRVAAELKFVGIIAFILALFVTALAASIVINITQDETYSSTLRDLIIDKSDNPAFALSKIFICGFTGIPVGVIVGMVRYNFGSFHLDYIMWMAFCVALAFAICIEYHMYFMRVAYKKEVGLVKFSGRVTLDLTTKVSVINNVEYTVFDAYVNSYSLPDFTQVFVSAQSKNVYYQKNNGTVKSFDDAEIFSVRGEMLSQSDIIKMMVMEKYDFAFTAFDKTDK